MAYLALQPVYAMPTDVRFAGLAIDSARIFVIRPPSDTIKRRTIRFAPDADTLEATFEIELAAPSETFQVTLQLLAAGQIVFQGTQAITVDAGSVAGTPPTPQPVTLSYTGPGAGVASLAIVPRDSGVTLGGTAQFGVVARDSQNVVLAQYYVGWRTNSAVHGIDANGLFRAGNARGRVMVWARAPNGTSDSTSMFVVPVPTSISAVGGNGQTGPGGLPLPTQLAARVLAADNLPVGGVTVAFAAATGGGSVLPATAVTDSLGIATTTATLGATVGGQTFTASVPGTTLTPATFSATATTPGQPVIVLSIPDTIVGVGFSPALQVTLLQAAPTGGLTVTVISDSTQYLTVAAPGTIAFNAGETVRTIGITGVALGLATVRATAPGYTPDTLFVPVIPPFLSLPAATNVGVSQSTQVTVTALPRAVGALAVTLVSSDPAIASVTTPNVNIPAGQATVNATVQGVAAGTALVTATAAGYFQGATLVTVGTGGVPATLTKTAGDNQTAIINDTVAVRPRVRVLDAGGAPVAGVNVVFVVASGGGSISGGASVISDATGFATLGGTWRMGGTPVTNTLTASVPLTPTVPAVTFNATAVLPPPVIQLSVFGSTVVGQARTGVLNVRLLQAPAGALTVNLVTTRTGLLRIGTYTSESNTVNFVGGPTDTLRTITVFGDSLVTGIDTVIATGTGYTPDTLAVPISLNLISLPAALNVPLAGSVSLPINLSVAAPVGGLQVAVSSSDPAVVQVTTPTVTVPQGSQVANATVQGVAIGSATLTATNPNYAPDQTTANVTASLNITTTSITPNASFGLPIVIQLESGGLPVSAPAGGIAVTMTSRPNPTCATAPNTNIPAGLVSAAVLVTHGGTTTLPCTTYIVASGPAGFTSDSVFVNMQPQPAIFINPTFLGSGLQRNVGGSLGASNHGGTTVRVTSVNPSLFVISLTDSTPGSAFVDIPIPVNGSSFNYYVQALDGFTADSANMIATATAFVPDTAKLNVYQPVFDIIFLNGTGNTRTANDAFQVRTGSPFTATGGLSAEDQIRAGGATRTFNIINDSVAVGELLTTALTGDSVTVQIATRQTRSPGTVATGGVELDYTAAGVTNVRAHSPGFRSVGAAAGQAVTVTAPVIFMSPTFIGARLQRLHSGSLSAVGIAGDTVTLKVSRTGILRISPNDSTGFADSIQVAVGVGSSSFIFYIQGVDTVTADSVDVIATLPSFTPDTARYTVFRPVFDIIFLNGSGNTRSANDAFQVRTGSAFTATGGLSAEDPLRFGHAPVTFSVVNDSAAVAELLTTALTGDSVTVQIQARQTRSPGNVATGGVELDYTAAGVTNVRANATGFRSVGAALGQPITVTAPSIFLSGTFIGARLQRQHSGSLSAVGVAGDTVTLKTTRSGVLRISPNDSTGFADSIQIAIGVGSSSFVYYIQGVDNVTADSVDVIATLPSFTADTARYTVFTPVFDIIFLNSTANALATSDPFQVRLGSAFTTTGGLSSEDVLRFGHAPVTSTVFSNQPSVAQLVTQTQTGNTGTVTVGPRQSRSPTSVATGGIELDYLTTGSTVVTADIPGFRSLSTVTVTVTAPFASLFAATVGSGLQEGTFGTLSSGNHGGIDIVVRSSSPGVALVSPNATTPGTDSIVLTVAPGVASFNYFVQGVEGQTGQVTFRATAPGFTDGTATMTVLQPAVDVIFLASSGNATTPTPTADDEFQVRIGYANAPSNTFMNAEQAVRAGAPGPLTVTINSTLPAAGVLKTTAQPGGAAQVTVQIAVGQARSPTPQSLGGVAFDFVAAGQTFVVPTITGFITVQQTVSGTPGFRVTVNP